MPARSPLPPETSPRREPATENASVQSPTILVFVVAAMVGVLAYTIFLFDPSNRGHWLPYSLVVTAELVLIAQALLSMWTILSGGQDPRDFAFHAAREAMYDQAASAAAGLRRAPNLWPLRLESRPASIDVFVTVYGEDLAVIERTVRAAVAMRGAHLTWVLDDGRSDEVRDLAARLGARYIRRLSSNGAKAGNINHALTISKAEYFAIFDADFVPDERFLEETMPFFTAADVAFVQTPQAYGNMRNLISRGAGYMQAVFYRFVQPGRNKFNAAFCVGTNVVFRRSAIDSIGGMYTDSKSEDVWTSLQLHERGWRSIYIPVTLALGNAPETIEDYTKQQMRWATGGFEILLSRNPLSRKVRLTPDQRIQYLATASHYLVGIVPLLLLIVPPLEIFFDLRPVNLSVDGWTWFAFYFGFYGLQILLAFHTMGSFRFETLLLASVSFPIYVRALMNVLEGRQQKWHVTGGARARKSPFNFMIPQLLTFAFLVISSSVGIYKDAGNGLLTLATAWNVTNMVILGVFVATAFGELAATRREARAAVAAPVPVDGTTTAVPAPISLQPDHGALVSAVPTRSGRRARVLVGSPDTQERSA